MKGLIAAFIMAMALTGCWKKELTAEQKALVSELQQELQKTKNEVAEARTSLAKYSGGLIKILIETRLEVLQTNEALLQQRIHAIESDAPVTVQTQISTPDPVAATALANEISLANEKLASARADAAKYTGGLIVALKLSAIATQEQTLALLEQRYLSAKYGLAITSTPAMKSSATQPDPAIAQGDTADIGPKIEPANGPLGFKKGLSKAEIEAMVGSELTAINPEENLYGARRAPKANAALETIALVVSPTVGLCQIRALSKEIQTNGHGFQLQIAFQEMKDALSSVYGQPQLTDRLIPGSIWNKPQEWMMALLKQDRALTAHWQNDPDSPLKNDLEGIYLQARAKHSEEGFYMLQYDFSNISQCESEQKNNRTNSL
ncbi:hypothetical protein [Pseudomonas sp. USHLN015]|uniref:hypothetical protein n=1 Tax=Pseudomonas sp. USHLN015 TaxID=3081296 RepID=UPI00301C1182